MLDQETIQNNFLENCIKNYKIIVDTCSLITEGVDKFWLRIVPMLSREGKSIILPYSVYLELNKLAAKNDLEAIRARDNLIRLQRAKLIEVYADPNDGDFADNVILRVLTQKRLQYNILLITQDRGLASEALKIGKDNAAVQRIKSILVQKINKDGFLEIFFDNKDRKPAEPPPDIPAEEKFNLATQVVNIEGKLPVSHVPTQDEFVVAVKNGNTTQIKLLEEIGAGGEGSVYKTDIDGVVAKIYKSERLTRLRYEKLRLMLSKRIDCDGVCFPLAMLYNQRNLEFVGYLMKSAAGKELGRSIFLPPLLKKHFPHWQKADTVQLCVTILKKLKYLHDRNIILGDINPYNILVVSPTEIYFVDTDSYQVEGFICPVGMPTFTPPELQNKPIGLRSFGNESFAIATLLFMIMLPGKPPYAMQGGESLSANIIKGDFSYPLGEKKTGKAPMGPWRYCWSHLPYKIKETFYETFRYDGSHHAEQNRYSTAEWLRQFEYYLDLLNSGKMLAQDAESLQLFPKRFKKQKDINYVKCRLCGREVEEYRTEQGICKECLNDGEHHKCARCGEEMIYTNYQKYIKHSRPYELCQKCSETVFEQRVCPSCGSIFSITFGEKLYFDNNGLVLPRRCKNCRGKSF